MAVLSPPQTPRAPCLFPPLTPVTGCRSVGNERAPDGVFAASSVLAKHDENYMPREVVDALKKSGRWQEGGGVKGAAAEPTGMPLTK